MPQHRSFRRGWSYERFAKYVIGKFAFIAAPDTIGDDIGYDLSGFFIRTTEGTPFLLPEMPFVLQVKPPSFRTKKGRVAKKHVKYISEHLAEYAAINAPIYIGIVTENPAQIDVYSNQGIVALHALYGEEELAEMIAKNQLTLKMDFVDTSTDFPIRFSAVDSQEITLLLHRVTTVTAETGVDSEELNAWRDDCRTYVDTLVSYNSGEFIYEGSQLTQFMGIGTFSHALKRLLHAACMIIEELQVGGDRFVSLTQTERRDLIFNIGRGVLNVESLRKHLNDTSILDAIVDDRRWDAWFFNVVHIVGMNLPATNDQPAD